MRHRYHRLHRDDKKYCTVAFSHILYTRLHKLLRSSTGSFFGGHLFNVKFANGDANGSKFVNGEDKQWPKSLVVAQQYGVKFVAMFS